MALQLYLRLLQLKTKLLRNNALKIGGIAAVCLVVFWLTLYVNTQQQQLDERYGRLGGLRFDPTPVPKPTDTNDVESVGASDTSDGLTTGKALSVNTISVRPAVASQIVVVAPTKPVTSAPSPTPTPSPNTDVPDEQVPAATLPDCQTGLILPIELQLSLPLIGQVSVTTDTCIALNT